MREPEKGREEEIDEMVEMIDRLMDEGSMHVRVSTQDEEGTDITTGPSEGCGGGACMQPTEKQELSEKKERAKGCKTAGAPERQDG